MFCFRCKGQERLPNSSYCRSCENEYRRNWGKTPKGRLCQKKSREKYKEYQREYARNWYAKNGRNRAVDYQEAITEWIKRNPEKVQAKLLVAKAVKEGKIIKPKNCSKCNRETRLSGHHPDYAKPLEVLWLCSSCHKLEHNKISTSRSIVVV